MNILIVDDELLIRKVVCEYAKLENYNIFEAENGKEAIRVFQDNKIDVVVMDIMMPKMDGYAAIKAIKEIDRSIPVIVLSAREDEYDKLMGFDLGIDDYVTKPFSPKELMARIKAIINRSNKIIKQYSYKELKVDYPGHIVTISNQEIKLTPKEYELLIYFIENENIALSREQLISKVWGYDYPGDDRTIDTHIKMLRKNLGKYRHIIKTVHGVGYKYETKE